jgi:hypothetical protein
MHPRYAYSLNGQDFHGSYPNREEALAAAIKAARADQNSPQTAYVARCVPADPKAAGHARAVLANMTARARGEFGDSASGYLARLSRQQIDNLDKSLELVILGWLEHNELLPRFSRYEAIGQYSIPGAESEHAGGDSREVQEIGTVAAEAP